MVNHFNCTNCVQVVDPGLATVLDVGHAFLTILCIYTWLNVTLEPVIKTGTIDSDVCRTDNRESPGRCTVRIGRIALFEVWVA